MAIKVVGLRIRKFVSVKSLIPVENTAYTIMLQDGHKKYQVNINDAELFMRINRVDQFDFMTHRPKDKDLILGNLTILDSRADYVFSGADVFSYNRYGEPELINCPVFSYQEGVFDDYDKLIRGRFFIQMELFHFIEGTTTNRLVYILTGNDDFAKLNFAQNSSKSIFNTDNLAENALPEDITADVVVLGNKHHFTVEQVNANLFGNPKVIEVNFSEAD
jgi:hypothetical protein